MEFLFNLLAMHPVIFSAMIFFFFIFIISFFIAFSSEENHRSSSVLKFSPSVMTSLGLLGTFWSLITSLGALSGGIGGNSQIDISKIALFMDKLEQVFYFSVMGIGSAILFMFLNLLVSQKNSNKAREEKVEIVSYQYELNESSNTELKQQSEFLKNVKDGIARLSSTMSNMQTGYDSELLGLTIGKELNKHLSPVLNNISESLSLSQNHHDENKRFLEYLSNDILSPIKNEVSRMTNSNDNMIKVISQNHQVTQLLLEKMDKTIFSMDNFIKGVDDVVLKITDNVEMMKNIQDNQQIVLNEFNEKLKTNLDKIQPAIENGMKTAETSLVSVIGIASGKMNDNLTIATESMKDTLEATGSQIKNIITELDKAMKDNINDMNELQKEQNHSMQKFNHELSDNLNKIQPAIENGMQKAENTLVSSIDKAGDKMNNTLNHATQDMKATIETASEKMNTVVVNLDDSMTKTMNGIHELQEKQKESLITFNNELSDNLNKIQPAIEKGMQKAEDTLVDAINTASSNMNSTLQNATSTMQNTIQTTTDGMQNIVVELDKTMQHTTSSMSQLQQEQDRAMTKFNEELSENLAKIEPSIKDSMKVAKEEMVGAIKTTTNEMNTAMTSVIDGIATKVVDNLGGVLTSFNEQMDNHLNRMNTELEQIGHRSKELMDKSADSLEKTLGGIDKTLEQSSEKLQNELKAFRNEYQLSLTEFFTKQNDALEQTLGVQNQRLQATADQLGQQFEKMIGSQETINKESQLLLTNMDKIYNPLLSKMTIVSENLNQGSGKMIKELRDMQEHTGSINNALKELGETMPKSFTHAFELLNKEYINKFNASNEMLEKSMREFTTAAAALISTSKITAHQ